MKCSICQREQPEEAFPWKDKKAGRRAKFCKRCNKQKILNDKLLHPERYKEYKHRAREKSANNLEALEKRREAGRRYYQRHKEEVYERTSRYQKEHREQVRKWQKDWAHRHPKKIQEYRQRWYRSEGFRPYCQEWKANHLEQIRETQRRSKRKWRREHPEEARRYDREYRKREKAKLTDKADSEAKRARKKNASGKFTRKDIELQLLKQDNKCFWCQEDLNGIYHVDHLIPLSKGGSNGPENLVIACPSCNVRRNNKLPEESIVYLQENWKKP